MTRQKINRISVLTLVAGLGSALAIYVIARPREYDPLLGDPLDNKKYIHELALYGGQANVMSAEFMDWFGSLWHGQRLAFTVAVLALAGIGIFRFIAMHPANMPADPADRASGDQSQG